jgi:hypothetical protein
MRAVVRSIGVVLLGIAAAVLLGLSSALVSVIALAATTALIMGGTTNRSAFAADAEFVDGYTAGANRCIGCEVAPGWGGDARGVLAC